MKFLILLGICILLGFACIVILIWLEITDKDCCYKEEEDDRKIRNKNSSK